MSVPHDQSGITPLSSNADCAANPLLDFSGLPRFADIRAEHVTPALDVLLERARVSIEHASSPDTPATWDDVVASVERASVPLTRVWSVLDHLCAVANTQELRKA